MAAQGAIRAYKAKYRLTWVEVASRLGISIDYAKKLGCGDRPRTSKHRARRIERRSAGEIRADELVL